MDVSVIAFRLGNWSDTEDVLIRAGLPSINFYYLSATRRPFIRWFFSSVIEKVAKMVAGKTFFKSINWYSYAIGKRSWILYKYLKKKDISADCIIAHNPDAFFPALYWSRKKGKYLGIDVEDYHPGETTLIREKLFIEKLMSLVLPAANYVSYASPGIKHYSLQLLNFNLEENKHHFTINNVFDSYEFNQPFVKLEEKELKLVWFSQNIDYKRGIEIILKSLDKCTFPVSLTLIGNLRHNFYDLELKKRTYLKFVEPLGSKELHKKLATFDVGLALEDSAAGINRNICLTNKIWCYLQAGLFILATDTIAQKDFINNWPDHGILSKNTVEDLVIALTIIRDKKTNIRKYARERFIEAKHAGWEFESKVLADKWKKLL